MDWLNKRPWLPQPAAQVPEPEEQPPTMPGEITQHDPPSELPCLEFRPLRCPACNNDRVPYYSKRGRLRYHLCRDCGARFRSLEV